MTVSGILTSSSSSMIGFSKQMRRMEVMFEVVANMGQAVVNHQRDAIQFKAALSRCYRILDQAGSWANSAKMDILSAQAKLAAAVERFGSNFFSHLI